jgi:hypothetical protein
MADRFSILPLTSVFVFLGIARYAYLAFRGDSAGERPEKLLISDAWLWVAIGGYALTAAVSMAVR